jgi:uncharacterized protein YjgD (DUF1641 family)
MQLSNWSEHELVALARVYVKHKQFNRSENVRVEISQRLSESAEANTSHLSDLLNELNALQETPLTERLRSLFVTRRQVA